MRVQTKREIASGGQNGGVKKPFARSRRLFKHRSPSTQGSSDTDISLRRSARVKARATPSASPVGAKLNLSPEPETKHSPKNDVSGVPTLKIMKIYTGGQLYSVFDHRAKKYIYKRNRKGDEDFVITYSDKRRCAAIQNAKGDFVYMKQKRRHD